MEGSNEWRCCAIGGNVLAKMALSFVHRADQSLAFFKAARFVCQIATQRAIDIIVCKNLSY